MSDLFKNRYRIKSARCFKWDYRSDAAYFITICVDKHDALFGKVENRKVILSEAGKIAEKSWAEIPLHFPFIILDAFVIMPNHMHGILIIDNGTHVHHQSLKSKNNDISLKCTRNDISSEFMSQISPKKGSVSTVVRSYKSSCTNKINRMNPGLNFKWQTRFYDRIIREQKSHQSIRQYILNNPAKWDDDIFRR